MTIQTTKTGIHIPSIEIDRFRGIRDLEIPRFGQVNLFGGKNGAGKTSLLEAIVAGAYGAIVFDEELRVDPRWKIQVGSEQNIVSSDAVFRDEQEREFYSTDPDSLVGKIRFGEYDDYLKLDVRMVIRGDALWHRRGVLKRGAFPQLGYENSEVDVAVLDAGKIAVPSLVEIEIGSADDGLAALAVFESGEKIPIAGLGHGALSMINIMAQMVCPDFPVELRGGSMGLNGVLLVDEIDDGLHRTVHTEFWRLVMREAAARNVQVFATTHSWDCILGFAEAGMEFHDLDPLYYRLERGEDRTYAIGYPPNLLEHAVGGYGDPR